MQGGFNLSSWRSHTHIHNSRPSIKPRSTKEDFLEILMLDSAVQNEYGTSKYVYTLIYTLKITN